MNQSTLSRHDSDESMFNEELKGSQVGQQYFKKEEDFLYGQISGSQLQEWRVIKYNKKGKAKDRFLMIDGLNLQHRKLQENQGFFGSLASGGIFKGSKSK